MPYQKPHFFKTIFYVTLDSFFASVEQALHPHYRGRPVVVGGHLRRAGVVASANYQARALGVKTGMPLAQAYRFAPEAIFTAGSQKKYEEFSREFFRVLSRFTDGVEPVSLDEAYLDMSDFDQFDISPVITAQRIQAALFRELEITASVGIAANKVSAQIAARIRKPQAIVSVPQNEEKRFLSPLPLRYLPGIGPRTVCALRTLGYCTIGHLAGLPERLLLQSFGPRGLLLSELANGIDERPVLTPGRRKSVSRSATVDYMTKDASLLRQTLHDLLSDACQVISTDQTASKTIMVKFREASGQTKSHQLTLPQPTSSHRVVGAVATKLFHEMLQEKNDICSLTVCLAGLSRRSPEQDLFATTFHKLKKIREAASRIKKRFNFSPVAEYGVGLFPPAHKLSYYKQPG